MNYRVLGKSGLKVSALGFGGIPIQRIDAEGRSPAKIPAFSAREPFSTSVTGTISASFLKNENKY